jgi:hypothetical protein
VRRITGSRSTPRRRAHSRTSRGRSTPHLEPAGLRSHLIGTSPNLCWRRVRTCPRLA